jgi:hypothetical protein
MQYNYTSNIEPIDVENDNDNNNTFLSTASCGISPLDSGNDKDKDKEDDNIVYEVVSKGSNDTPEKPAESMQAELSTQSFSYYSILLTFYSQITL